MKLELKLDRGNANKLIVLFYQLAIPERRSIRLSEGTAVLEVHFENNANRVKFLQELEGEIVEFEDHQTIRGTVETGCNNSGDSVADKGGSEASVETTESLGDNEIKGVMSSHKTKSVDNRVEEVPANPDSESGEEETAAASETGSDQIGALVEQSQGTGVDDDVGGRTFLEEIKSKSAAKEQFLNSVAEELFKRGNVQKRFKVFLHDVINTKAESILKSCETADLGISTVNQGVKKRTGKTTREFFLELIRIYDSWNVENEISWEMLRDSLKGSPEEKNQQLFDRDEFSEETIKRYGKINGNEPKAILSVMREVCLKVFRGKSPEEATKELTNIERCDFSNILHLYAQMNGIKPIRVGEFLELIK